VRLLTRQVAAGALHLFPVADAIEWRYFSGGVETGAGQNPPAGALIHYYLKAKPTGDATLEILDAQGKLVRTLTSRPKQLDASYEWEVEEAETDPRKPDLEVDPGVHRAVWDLRWAGAAKIPGAKLDAGDPKTGPFVLPGTYTVKLSVDGQSQSGTLVVKQDSRLTVPPADLAAQVSMALSVRDDISRLTGIVTRLRDIARQARERAGSLKGEPKAAELVKASLELAAKSDALEGKLHNPKAEVVYDILAQQGGAKLYSRISPLFSWITDGDGAPTPGARQVYEEQRQELKGYEAELEALVDTDLAAVNRQAASLGVPFIVEGVVFR
jgi:hypothetical protein